MTNLLLIMPHGFFLVIALNIVNYYKKGCHDLLKMVHIGSCPNLLMPKCYKKSCHDLCIVGLVVSCSSSCKKLAMSNIRNNFNKKYWKCRYLLFEMTIDIYIYSCRHDYIQYV